MYTREQYACHCCGQLPYEPDPRAVNALAQANQYFSEQLGQEIEINMNCCYRCPPHNEEVGGQPNSNHMYAAAIDCDASIMGVDALAGFFESIGVPGVMRYYGDCFVHIDFTRECNYWATLG